MLNRRGLPWFMSTWKLEVGSVSSTMIIIDGEDLPEDQSGTIPKWLASGTTYILVVIDELYLTTGLRMYYA